MFKEDEISEQAIKRINQEVIFRKKKREEQEKIERAKRPPTPKKFTI